MLLLAMYILPTRMIIPNLNIKTMHIVYIYIAKFPLKTPFTQLPIKTGWPTPFYVDKPLLGKLLINSVKCSVRSSYKIVELLTCTAICMSK